MKPENRLLWLACAVMATIGVALIFTAPVRASCAAKSVKTIVDGGPVRGKPPVPIIIAAVPGLGAVVFP